MYPNKRPQNLSPFVPLHLCHFLLPNVEKHTAPYPPPNAHYPFVSVPKNDDDPTALRDKIKKQTEGNSTEEIQNSTYTRFLQIQKADTNTTTKIQKNHITNRPLHTLR